MIRMLCRSFFFFFISFQNLFSNLPWIHLELGAGNYGKEGHTRFFQSMGNEDSIVEPFKPEEQYGVLFWTLDQLIERYGDRGIFYLNDIYAEHVEFAAEKLREYAAKKGYSSILIETISGDYRSLDFGSYLSKYDKIKYDSIHLKNPEIYFFREKMADGRCLFTVGSREKARGLLQALAHLSDTGLYFFILYSDGFIPLEEKVEMERGIFYLATDDWDPVPYIYPEGIVIDRTEGRVFLIKN